MTFNETKNKSISFWEKLFPAILFKITKNKKNLCNNKFVYEYSKSGQRPVKWICKAAAPHPLLNFFHKYFKFCIIFVFDFHVFFLIFLGLLGNHNSSDHPLLNIFFKNLHKNFLLVLLYEFFFIFSIWNFLLVLLYKNFLFNLFF